MDNFEIHNDTETIAFLFNFSELEGRLDPLFYLAIENIQQNIIDKEKYECKSLIKSCKIKRGRFGHRPRNDPRFYGGEYPFIQTGDIVKASENNTSIEFTQSLNALGLSTSKLFQPPKLLFTIAANIGDTAILDYPSCFPDSIVALIPHDENALSIEYLNTYLKLIKPYIVELAPYSAQSNLNNQQLAQVPIVLPPIDVQLAIATQMEIAYLKKQEKLSQAQQLLDSIDNYLLSELGITLPKQDNSLENRIFTTDFSKVSGSRLDPFYNQLFFDIFKNPKSKYQNARVKEIAREIKTGLPVRKDHRIENGKYPYYGANGIIGYMDEYTHDGRYLVVGQDGYIGNHYVVEGRFWGSNHNWVIELKNGYNYHYIKSILDLLRYEYLITGGVIPKLTKESLASIKIPIPPIEKQNEISDKISRLRQQAKQLQKEAEQEMQTAKKRVERMILEE